MMNVLFTPTLCDAFERAGLPFPGEPEPGKLACFSTNGTKGDAAGWLRLFPDAESAAFGCWREGIAFTWQRERDGPPPDAAELAAIRARAEQARRQAEAERETAYQDAAGKAAAVWQQAGPATGGHPYLSAKGIAPHVARLSPDGRLVVPVFANDGRIQTVQTIGADLGNPRNKMFMTGGKMQAGRCWLGEPTDAGPLVICEGYAAGASIREATGWPVCVAFTAGNLERVACDVRERHPRAKMLIAGDDDRQTEGNPGRTKALAAAARVLAQPLFPSFAGPDGSDFNDMAQQADPEAVARLIREAAEPPQRFRLLTPADLARLPPVRWRVRGVLPTEGIGAVFGPSGSGKSFLSLDLLATVAGGGDWFGCHVKPAPVLYVALEGEAGISQRVKAYETKHGPVSPGFRFMLQALDVRSATDRADLMRAIKAAGWSGGVLCLDTLNRAAPGMDENDSKSMGEVIAAAKTMQAELGGLVLLVHHTGKDATKGMRGHSSLHAALDAAVEVSRDGDRREWRMHKAKDGEDGKAHPFRLDVVELGPDDHGEPVTSCIVAPEQDAADAFRRVLPPKSGNQRIIWDALGDVLKASRHFGQAGAPPVRPCVSLEDAVEQTRGRLVCDPKRQTERTQTAITGLVARGLLEHREGWIWIV